MTVVSCALIYGLFPSTDLSAGPLRVDPRVLATIEDDDPRPLPRSRGGYRITRPADLDIAALEGSALRAPSEYERSSGVLLRWGSFNKVLTQIIVGITSGDPAARVHVLVRGSVQQERATDTLRRAGADLSRVGFISYLTDSAWMRDYGPQLIEELGREASVGLLLDHTYNRPRPRDDAFPRYLSSAWGMEMLDVPLVHAGGNIHVFSDGDAFVTDLIVEENADLPLWEIHAYYLTLADLKLTILPSLPQSYDPTGHIDMWMLPVRDREVIVGEYRAKDEVAYRITEQAVSDLLQRGYLVHRTPGWRSRGTHFTYTNSLIFNDLIFIPIFRAHPKKNAEALDTFKRAFPRKKVIPVESSRILSFDGALHCAVLQIPKTED